MKKLAEDWKKLPEQEKNPYVKKASEDKQRYEQEMKKYEQKN